MFLHILWMVVSIQYVENAISQISFKDRPETVCIYLYGSIIPLKQYAIEVNITIALELSLCHINDTIDQNLVKNRKEILIIQLSEDCSLIEQLNILKNAGWMQDYYAIIFSGKQKL